MSRREIREQIFKMLFRVEFYTQEELPEQIELFKEDLENISPADLLYIENKITKIKEVLDTIDEAVNEAAEKWKTSRMAKVDLTIIRLAVYEMRYDEEIPVSVAINEAVELAKKFGTDESAGFVNGILAKLV
ncbi:N utilization substance protein B homolog [uncultured Roseburia sp.]|uniref:Transcription antitermination protein NusB n=1 Tax=Brotonthovivens ammoniilytica TaxID=2981725 RepID=A0ABT2TFN7_9FIRM|nr:transcription antitermination factor NusB [Brotonthovivens ammoniilytica]MCU6761000.1 transcription antitermination factor NusB [Brotonthovivens ammoniilytica]SCI15917.1 N utilization substance protein B homolog [uncultured Roseburia sp.]